MCGMKFFRLSSKVKQMLSTQNIQVKKKRFIRNSGTYKYKVKIPRYLPDWFKQEETCFHPQFWIGLSYFITR